MSLENRLRAAFTTASIQRQLNQKLFTKQEQINFMEEFASLVAYLAPLTVLENIAKYAKGSRKEAALSMIKAIQSGQSIAKGMEGWFDPILIEAVRVGESSGGMTDLINKTVESLQVQQSGLSKSLLIMAYPFFLLIVILVATVGMYDTFMPIVSSMMKKGGTLPPDLQYVETFGEFLKQWAVIIAVSFISLLVALRWAVINYTGEYRDQLDNLPIFKHYRWMLGARLMLVYSILKAMSQTEAKIIEVASRNGSPYYRMKLRYMLRRIQSGSSLVQVLDTGLITPKNIERLQLLSATQEYADALAKASADVVKETAAKINRAARMLFVIGMVTNAYLIAKLLLAGMAVDQISFV